MSCAQPNDVQVIALPSDTLLQRLRHATQAAHEHLEQRLTPSARWTRPRLLAFLRGTLAVIQACEPGLRKHCNEFPLLHDASLRLRHDIARLGGDDAVPAVDGVDICSRAEAFGAAYVILGSQLGAQVLRPAVTRDLGISADSLTYFAGPKEVGKAWKSFASSLAKWDEDASEDLDDVTLRFAVNLFEAFTRAFGREGLDAL